MSRKSTGSTSTSAGGGSSNGAQSVKVFCRIRPSNKTEVASGGVVCVKYTDEMIEVKSEEAGEHKFNFDRILGMEFIYHHHLHDDHHHYHSYRNYHRHRHNIVIITLLHHHHHHHWWSYLDYHLYYHYHKGMDSTQPEVFSIIAQPLIKDILQGYNATILAYGQSGTGKVRTFLL